MKAELYHQFLLLKNQGQKETAKNALAAFIASFQNSDEKRSWVFSFLQNGEYGHKIRTEIYQQLVYPVLLEGYLKNHPPSVFWVARTANQLHTIPNLHPQLQDKSSFHLLLEAYQLEPSEAVRDELLQTLLRGFNYAQHEWPAGILYGPNGAVRDECQEILQDIELARQLDHNNRYDATISEFESRVHQYIARLQTRT